VVRFQEDPASAFDQILSGGSEEHTPPVALEQADTKHLRVLDALQTGELCPCNWQKGGATLRAA
jgi:hypothetical protein